MSLSKKQMWEMIEHILAKKGDLVLSTADKSGKVHVCIMSYVRTSKSEMLMTCAKTSVKIKNISQNSLVGLVKFEVPSKPSLLMYGEAEVLNQKAAESCRKKILSIAAEYEAFAGADRAFLRVKLTKVIYEWYYGAESEVSYFEMDVS